jgi:small multidrug resistance pump
MGTWALLACAIVAEIIATVSLKLSEGFTRLGPIVVVVVGYLISFFIVSKVYERGLPLSVVYAIWSAIGISALALIDTMWFKESLSTLQIVGLFIVVAGVAALQIGSNPQ